MPKVKNLKDLEKVIQPYIEKAMILTRDELFEVISAKVSDYYAEEVFKPPDRDVPDAYVRTGKLMESLTASNIEKNGNSLRFTVGFDDDYLTFEYPGNPNQLYNPPINPATGYDVLTWFNSSWHGGTVRGSHNYWDEAIEEINSRHGSIPNLFKKNCRKVGLKIK